MAAPRATPVAVAARLVHSRPLAAGSVHRDTIDGSAGRLLGATVVHVDHQLVGVIGASGGLGVSTMCVALAVRAGPRIGATVAVDLAPCPGALDVTACVEHEPGLRWAALSDARGRVDGAALLRALPGEGTLRVLAGSAGEVPEDVVRAGVRGLYDVCGLAVADLGRSLRFADVCTDLLLLSGTSARQLADASLLAGRLDQLSCPARLVLRTGRGDVVSAEEVAVHLDLPLAGTIRDDPRVVGDADRARVPGSRSSGPLARTVDAILAELLGAAGELRRVSV